MKPTLLAAAAMLVPQPDLAFTEFLFGTVSEQVEAEASWVAVTFNLWVHPDGRIAECEVGRGAGDASLVTGFCPKLVDTRLFPPRDEMGLPTFALVSYHFSAYSRPEFKRSRKVAVDLLSLPNGVDPDSALIMPKRKIPLNKPRSVELSIDRTGSVRACRRADRMTEKHVSNKLVAEACAQASRKRFEVRRSADGEPVQYVRSVILASGR